MKSNRIGDAASSRGSIEGLPLQLLIMIVIAAVGLGILIAWLASVDDIKEIGKVVPMADEGAVVQSVVVSPLDYQNYEGAWEDSIVIVIKVYDTEMNPLQGVTVTLSGCGTSGTAITDDTGEAWLGENPMVITLPVGIQSGDILVQATKSGYGDGNTHLPVTRGETAGLMTAGGFI